MGCASKFLRLLIWWPLGQGLLWNSRRNSLGVLTRCWNSKFKSFQCLSLFYFFTFLIKVWVSFGSQNRPYWGRIFTLGVENVENSWCLFAMPSSFGESTRTSIDKRVQYFHAYNLVPLWAVKVFCFWSREVVRSEDTCLSWLAIDTINLLRSLFLEIHQE